MLYFTLAAILIGSCAIETSANKLVIRSIPDGTVIDVTGFAVPVTPTTKGKIGWVISYKGMQETFPQYNFMNGIIDPLQVTVDGKLLNNLTIHGNMQSREIQGEVPYDIVATYILEKSTCGLFYNKAKRIEHTGFYFEGDE